MNSLCEPYDPDIVRDRVNRSIEQGNTKENALLVVILNAILETRDQNALLLKHFLSESHMDKIPKNKNLQDKIADPIKLRIGDRTAEEKSITYKLKNAGQLVNKDWWKFWKWF